MTDMDLAFNKSNTVIAAVTISPSPMMTWNSPFWLMPLPTMLGQPRNRGGAQWILGTHLVFSPKSLGSQQKYSAFNRELYVCYKGIIHFPHMLEGRRFIIHTDL